MKTVQSGLTAALLVALLSTVSFAAITMDTWHGDFKFRVENIQDSDAVQVLRERLRLRLGTKFEINPDANFHFGLASGSFDGRSEFQTLGDNGANASYSLLLDYAYLDYELLKNQHILIGKSKNPFHTAAQLIWDRDLNFDGASLALQNGLGSGWTGHLVLGSYVFSNLEKTGVTGAKLWSIQPQLAYASDDYSAKVSLGYHVFNNVKGKTLNSGGAASSGRNNSVSGGVLTNDYQPVTLGAESTLNSWMGLGALKLFGEGVYNTSVSEKNKNMGFLVGAQLGALSVKRAGEWQVQASWRLLQTDAWIDVFPESDALKGWTGVKGLSVGTQYGVAANVVMGLNMYFMEALPEVATAQNITQTLIQFDTAVSF